MVTPLAPGEENIELFIAFPASRFGSGGLGWRAAEER